MPKIVEYPPNNTTQTNNNNNKKAVSPRTKVHPGSEGGPVLWKLSVPPR